MVTRWRVVLVCLSGMLCLPALAHAQASIAGVVSDPSGAVLPGVTVEAASPALIERVRTVVTDGSGRYRIVDLRPGVYAVTFSLPGFTSVTLDGIELAGSFTATVNVEMKVSALQETITVTGEAPTVDVQGTASQRVIAKEVLDAIPTGRNHLGVAVLIPGITSNIQDVGGTSSLGFGVMTIHGSRSSDQRVMVDGFVIRNVAAQGQNTNVIPDMGSTQEMAIDYAAGSADQMSGGLKINYVPREGGNSFTGSFFATGANASFQGDNYSDELKARGLTARNSLKSIYDVNGSLGGPVLRDRLWFFSSARAQATRTYVAGIYENLNAGDPNAWAYVPDLARQGVAFTTQPGANSRLTWQAAAKHKISLFYEQQGRDWLLLMSNTAPEAATHLNFPKNRIATGGWTSPLSSRLLLDIRAAHHAEEYLERRPPAGSVFWSLIPVTEQGGSIPGLTYRAPGIPGVGGTRFFRASMPTMFNVLASLSYVTGAHAFKVGVSDFRGRRDLSQVDNESSLSYRFNNGIPNQITQRATPSAQSDVLNGEMGVYAQDRWTFDRVTVNAGVRIDVFNTYFPEQHLGPATLIPSRDLTFPRSDWYGFRDVSPRLGVAYDLFGTGRTAVKASMGRYVLAIDPTIGNPVFNLAHTVTRSWGDEDRDHVPDCNIRDPQANGECGRISDLRFGQPLPSTSFDPDTRQGWGKRPYNWEFSANVEHEVVPRLGVSLGYFRRIYGNFTVTDNRAVGPADFDSFSISAPSDARLPGGGGYVIDRLFNLNPLKVGIVDNYVVPADRFGKQTEHWNGVDLTTDSRLGSGLRLQGGLSTGRTSTNNCEILSALPEVGPTAAPFCDIQTRFRTQVKLLATYLLPRLDVQIAATLQSLPGPEILGNFVASNAAVAPSLGRNLSGGAANVTVNIVQPGTLYGERLNQLDVRFGKMLRFGRTRTTISLDLYNALNGNAVRTQNNNYASWQTPTAILDARLAKVGLRVDF